MFEDKFSPFDNHHFGWVKQVFEPPIIEKALQLCGQICVRVKQRNLPIVLDYEQLGRAADCIWVINIQATG